VGVEPKLDGIRCFAIVEDGEALLYARSGKLITNFDDTIGEELSRLGDGCYDGEIMGKDFIALMRQAYRKENVITEGTYLALFDFLPLEEWKSRSAVMSCQDRYAELGRRIRDVGEGCLYIRRVQRYIVAAVYPTIKGMHDEFVAMGYEGAMVKDLDAAYKFGRGPELQKLKTFHDVDLKIERLVEGTGKHSGKLGSVVVVFNGVEVQVGSGFSDELRETIWARPDDFVGRMIEARYQEVTPDGSLRFPTFVCFRNDR
jgi:DNA ligase-1